MTISKKPSDEVLAYIATQVKLVWVEGQPRLEWMVTKGRCKAGQLVISERKRPHTTYRVLHISPPALPQLRLSEHNLVWYFLTGEWPTLELDHRDGNGLNNHPDNLRLATTSQNVMNCRKTHNQKSSPYRGVHKVKNAISKPWRAQVYKLKDGKRLQVVKCFGTPEEAYAWRTDIAKQWHGEFFHG